MLQVIISRADSIQTVLLTCFLNLLNELDRLLIALSIFLLVK